ncbi:MAG TPA: hypothetical protein VGJ27_05660 [Gaiellaceae bacterium]
MRHAALAITVALLAAATAACGGGGGSKSAGPPASSLPRGSAPFEVDPSDFTTTIDNPYWPMKPGSHWVYREINVEGDLQRNDVVVTNRTKTIMGIEAVVVHDTVKQGGQLTEDTYDWYAQDSKGNLWYLGEDTTEYEHGKVKTKEGSWEAGVDGALGGIIVPAHPRPGLTYREEYYKGHAEDGAEVLSLHAHAKVPYGTYDGVLQTRNFSPIEPNVVEEKFYARGLGVVLELTVSGGSDRGELISFEQG